MLSYVRLFQFKTKRGKYMQLIIGQRVSDNNGKQGTIVGKKFDNDDLYIVEWDDGTLTYFELNNL